MTKNLHLISTLCFITLLLLSVFTLTSVSYAKDYYTESEIKAMYDENSSTYIGQYTSYEYDGIQENNIHLVGTDYGVKVDFGNFSVPADYKKGDVVIFIDFKLYNQNGEKVGFGNMPVAVSGTTPLTTTYSQEISYEYLPVRVDVSYEIIFSYKHFQGNINAYEYCNSIDATKYKIVPDDYDESVGEEEVKLNNDIDEKAKKPLTFKEKVIFFLIVAFIIYAFICFIKNTTFEVFWLDGKLHTIRRPK